VYLQHRVDDLESEIRSEEPPAAVAEGDPMSRASCRTPNGVRVELWEFEAPA
jgi:hypothetical protein